MWSGADRKSGGVGSLSLAPGFSGKAGLIQLVLTVLVFWSWVLLLLGVPKPGRFKPGCLQFLRGSALFALFLRPFALICGLAFVLICAHLRSFAHICVFLSPTVFRTTAFGNCRSCPSFHLRLGASGFFFPWASILLHGPLDICLDVVPAAPLPPVQKQDAQHLVCNSLCLICETKSPFSANF